MKFMCSKCGKIFDGKNSYSDCSKHEELCGCDENQKMKIVSLAVSYNFELSIFEHTIRKDKAHFYDLGSVFCDLDPLVKLNYNPEEMTLNDALKKICRHLSLEVKKRKEQFEKQMDNYRKIIAMAEHTEKASAKTIRGTDNAIAEED